MNLINNLHLQGGVMAKIKAGTLTNVALNYRV
jgi:hypothetical protein